jgi:hypothetical protein
VFFFGHYEIEISTPSCYLWLNEQIVFFAKQYHVMISGCVFFCLIKVATHLISDRPVVTGTVQYLVTPKIKGGNIMLASQCSSEFLNFNK